MEEQILNFIQEVYIFMGWPGVVILMALESACIPIPSEVIMPLSGWMLVKAQGLGALHNLVAGLYGALGCTIGSVIAYWVGAWGGRPLAERYGRYVLVSHHDLEVADRWFARHGDWAIFTSRLLPVVRTFISLPAGIARMHFIKFLIYTFVGSFIWCLGLAYGGYLLGDNWEQIRAWMRPFDIPIIVAAVLLVAFFLYRRIRAIRRG